MVGDTGMLRISAALSDWLLIAVPVERAREAKARRNHYTHHHFL